LYGNSSNLKAWNQKKLLTAFKIPNNIENNPKNNNNNNKNKEPLAMSAILVESMLQENSGAKKKAL
jgi:hypothetical protein